MSANSGTEFYTGSVTLLYLVCIGGGLLLGAHSTGGYIDSARKGKRRVPTELSARAPGRSRFTASGMCASSHAADPLLMAVVEQARRDHRDADQRQRERE